MKLTDKEIEIMNVFWKSAEAMTAAEIIAASTDRTWQEISIHTILKTLLKKEAIVLSYRKPSVTRSAKAYTPTITREEYAAHQLRELDVDMIALINIVAEGDEKFRKLLYDKDLTGAHND